MSSNGIPLNHATLSVTLPGGPYRRKVIVRPPGTGGGCIERGPFANYTVHVDGTSTTGLGRASITTFSRPRCVTRDFYLPVLAQCTSYEKVSRLILNSADMTMFHNSAEGVNCGIHATGHVFIGGENMDLFSSPNDPMFFLHHANLDRIWSIYQSRDPEKRMYAQAGTHTFMNCKFSLPVQKHVLARFQLAELCRSPKRECNNFRFSDLWGLGWTCASWMSWKSSFLGSMFNCWFGLLALTLALDVTLQNLAI